MDVVHLRTYVPVQVGWGLLADSTLADLHGAHGFAAGLRSEAEVLDTMPSPFQPDASLCINRRRRLVSMDVVGSLRSALADGQPTMLWWGEGLGIEPARVPTETFRQEWLTLGGTCLAKRFARPVGPPVAVGLNEGQDAFVLPDGSPLADPVAFLSRHAMVLEEGAWLFDLPLSYQIGLMIQGIARGERPDEGVFMHLLALAKSTLPMAAKHAAFAADLKTFDDFLSSPQQVPEDSDLPFPFVVREEVVRRRDLIVHVAAAESYCVLAGIGLGSMRTRFVDMDARVWGNYDLWLDDVAPGARLGADAARTTVPMEDPESGELIDRVRDWLGTPTAAKDLPDGLRLRTYERDGLVFMTGELHPNFEVVGWSRDAVVAGMTAN